MLLTVCLTVNVNKLKCASTKFAAKWNLKLKKSGVF